MRTTSLIILLALGWGASAQAAVLLNEVAWMGTEESYLCEWIELHNSSTKAVSIQDWVLQIGDGPLKSFQEGEFTTYTIPAGGYFVIERLVESCPNPVASVNDAKLAFGSIPNSDTTIRLYSNADGTQLADQLASGEDWREIGGDNTSKETAQYSPSGWFTAPATPGNANAEANISSGTTSEVEESRATSETTTPREVDRDSTETTLSLAAASAAQEPLTVQIEYPTSVYVGQPVQFTATPAGRGQTVRNSLHYYWNFGDLTTASGPHHTHQYMFPGEYVVSVEASYYEYQATEERTITVLPVKLRMNITSEGHLHIHNTAPYAVDVSEYVLSTVPAITFPDRSVIAARGTVTVPYEKLGTRAEAITLQDTLGNVISTTEAMPEEELPQETESVIIPTAAVAGIEETVQRVATSTTAASPQAQLRSASDTVTAFASQKGASDSEPVMHDQMWYALLGGLVVVGVVTIFITTPAPAVRRREELVE